MLSDLFYRLRALFRRDVVDGELDDELRVHFEQEVEKLVRRGLPPEEAARQARLVFGGVEQVKDYCRQAWGVRLIETTLQDVRYGLRTMRKFWHSILSSQKIRKVYGIRYQRERLRCKGNELWFYSATNESDEVTAIAAFTDR